MIREALQQKLAEAAKLHGFGHAFEYLLTKAKECIYIYADDNHPQQLGQSRLGGLPDLPDDAQWPEGLDSDGQPWGYADFVAQINFAELPIADGLPFPKRGYLWLFVRRFDDCVPTLITVCDKADQIILRPRPIPTNAKWAVAHSLGDDETTAMTDGTKVLRFEVGISLPFGQMSYEMALGLKSHADGIEFHDSLIPLDSVGQLGGYSFSSDGHHHQQDVALTQLGRPDFLFPYSYENVAELDAVLRNGPRWQPQSPEDLAKWKTKQELLRPKVEWIEQHRKELNEWQLLISLNSQYSINLEWGDAGVALYSFITVSDFSSGRFDHLASITAY